MSVTRGRISYGVGNKYNPGDPWGRSSLVIEPDGSARLDQDTLGGVFSFTGTVTAAALERFWKALDEAGFPTVAEHKTPAGSATRSLTIGDAPDAPTARIAYHATGSMPGYGVAFSLLDSVVRQISLDMVKAIPAGETIVEGAARVSA